jgi:putative aldouronate transport system permease protein
MDITATKANNTAPTNIKMNKKPLLKYMKDNFSLYTMVIPGIIMFIVFSYVPMYGIVMAFQDFKPAKGFFHSEWVGLEHFQYLFKDPYFTRIFSNTLLLGLYSLIFSFPAPIILALLINEIKNKKFKSVTQTISYLPHFLSVVIVIGLLRDLLSVNDGVINYIIEMMGAEKIDFFSKSKWFRTLYIGSGIWQGIGYSSIIYLAAISGINPELYESAVIDGASRIQQIIFITIPSIAPTIVILFIFAVGGVLGNDYQKILLMYSPLTYETADVIGTYVYRSGIEGTGQSYASAVGLLMSIISLVLISGTNWISRKLGETSLW